LLDVCETLKRSVTLALLLDVLVECLRDELTGHGTETVAIEYGIDLRILGLIDVVLRLFDIEYSIQHEPP
jgi:hypothetical protein